MIVKPKISIFLNHPECSAHCCVGMYEALHPHYKINFFNKDQIKSKLFKDLDIVAFPGGIGDSDTFDELVRPNLNYIKDYINNGGHYLGICMGAYWAGNHYFDILDGVVAEQYIKRPNADVKRSFGTVSTITWKNKKQNMYFYDGCSLLGNENKFDTIARYSNGDPMAIIQNRIGVIGCHPEALPSWYDKKHLQPYWHNYQHHKLLLDFTNELLSR
jgi:glutamine amidotransferase-like uncharacterized protein